ncbi:LysR family transcriptional regulator [Polynucleobacter sinensis]|uniref:LysR family transcriptional regulator n=1 Tax=Polynucleobacter sinensis TaxID=1743157 RepID=UPI000781A232|nr:LysR family transcriptional regulator [Polynucleobacter sinensis]
MTLKQLEAFYWAATCINFDVAAQRVHLSPSSLSKRISELETSLNKKLFDRSGHKATLTDDGVALLPGAHKLLEEAEKLRALNSENIGLSGVCKFGMGELSAMTWMPTFVNNVQAKHPALQMEVQANVGGALELQVERGELDFIVVAGPSSKSTLVSDPIGYMQFVWVCPFTDKDSSRLTSSEYFKAKRLITLPALSGANRALDKWLLANKLIPNERMFCNSWGGIAGLIAGNTGFGYFPEAWALELEKKQVLKVLREWPPIEPNLYTFEWRRDDTRPLIGEMLRFAKASISFSAPAGFN